MGIGHRLVATLGFVVPAALAAWVAFGVDARAAPPDIRGARLQQYAAYQVQPGRLHRQCEPTSPNEWVDECPAKLEVEVATDRVRAASYIDTLGTLEPRLAVPRTGNEWNALRHWLALQRREPIYDGRADFKVVARPGVPYGDIIRVLELADQAGFTAPQLVSSRAAEIDRPGPLRVTVTAAGVGADFDGAFPAHLPLVEGDRAWRGLATWLAERHADPRLDANDLDIVIDATLGARPRDVALARRALAQAGYDDWRTATRVDAAPAAIPPPPTALTR